MNALIEQFHIKNESLQLKHGDEIFRQGQTTESIYYVNKGLVQLYRDDLKGNRTILHQAFSGHFFAEASINADHYHCTAQCVGDTELLFIKIDYFNHLLDSNPAFSKAWIKHLSTELRRQRASVERLNLKTAIEKITHYISTEGNEKNEVAIKGTLTELAQIIGLSRESLYRTLSKMQKDQQIEKTNNWLKLLK